MSLCAASPRTIPGAARRLRRCVRRVARVPARRFWRCGSCKYGSPKLSRAKGAGVHCTRHFRAGAVGRVLATPPAARFHTVPTANIGDGAARQNLASPATKFGPAAGGARPRPRHFESRPADRAAALSRQPVAAAGREGQPLPASAVISALQDGRRRLHPDAQETRP